ncbi:uncharacterized protein [Dermacentor andersoni]|uniref:uncharacterized protein isoform X3 n=1 Tax=Dermacentor andersoni TaxID=34620 RepID=UPI0024177D88|nr:protein vein-like isoform X3 [Dermacentor andersoni]
MKAAGRATVRRGGRASGGGGNMWAAEHVLGGGDRPKSGMRRSAPGEMLLLAAAVAAGKAAAAAAAAALRSACGPASPSPPHAPSSRLRNAAQAASMTRPLPLLLPVVLVAAAASGARCPQDQDRWDASNKALTASLVFQGRLLSKSVDAAGNLLARFRVQKVLKPMPTATLRRRQEVVVALVKSRPPPTQQHLNRSASPRTPRRDALNNEALAPRRRTLCPVSVPQGFVFNARYLVYANPIAGRAARRLLLPAAANFSAAATPDHYTRRAGRAVKKVVCNGCVLKPAQAKWLRSTSRVDAYRRLQLRCKLNGNPVPWVQWYFMGKPVTPNSRVHIVTKWRQSRLEIKSARRQDSGLYECRAWNVLRKEPSTVSVSVSVRDRYPPPPPTPEPTRATASTTTNDSTLWPLKGRPCPLVSYCLNGGTCIFYEAVKEPVCQCAEGFIGQRCENKDTASLKRTDVEAMIEP